MNRKDEIQHKASDAAGRPDFMDCCKKFAEVTGTDTALAMMYLQDRNWDVETAVSAYFEDTARSPDSNSNSQPIVIDLTIDEPTRPRTDRLSCTNILTVLSWNIDGLNSTTFPSRLTAIITIIKTEQPHLICLQEVTSTGLNALRSGLANAYHILSASDDPTAECIHYFVAILVRKQTSMFLERDSFKVHPFPKSKMGRHLVSTDLTLDLNHWNDDSKVGDAGSRFRLRLYTAHLESCRESANERMSQLKETWTRMLDTTSLQGSIFCGDLNLRDSEITQIGGLPQGIRDVWEATGRRQELHCTWDPVRNSNAGRFPGDHGSSKFRGLRFDRMYWVGNRLKAVDFGLRGLEKLPKTTYFPSDHWGILGRFLIS